MYSAILGAHSHFRWLMLLSAILAIVLPAINSQHSSKSKLPALVFMILCDIQLLLGLTLYFGLSPLGIDSFSEGMSRVMKTPEIRKITIEHFALMLIAIAFVHIGYSKIKKATNQDQVKKLSYKFFGIAIALMLLGFPWFRFL